VDRFRAITGTSPAFERAAAAGEARRVGALAGELCAAFGIEWNLAPVVDRAVEGAGGTILAGRAASPDPWAVSAAAGEFLEGLADFGVAGCLKHFPGLGRASVDSHLLLPTIPDAPAELDRDLAPFRALARAAPAVMVSHASLGRGKPPATLDAAVATGLLRDEVGFAGLAISDDLEMGALSEFGGIPDRAAAAFDAGCDVLCFGKRTEALPEAAARVEQTISESRRAAAALRLAQFREALGGIAARRRSSARPLPAIAAAFRESSERLG